MFHPKPPKGTQPTTIGNGLSQKEMRTLTGLVVVFFVFFGAFIVVPFLGRSPQEGTVPATDELGDWTPRAEMGQPKIVLPEEIAAVIAEETEEQRVLREPEPFLYLLEQVNRRSYRFFKREGFKPTPPDQLVAAPEAHRAQPIEITGELISYEERPLEGGGALPKIVADGILKTDEDDGEGNPYYAAFTLTGRKPASLSVGDIVLAHGLFFKNSHFDVSPQGSPSFRTGPLFIAKKLMKTYYVEPVETLNPLILSAIDDSLDASKVLEFGPLYHTLAYVDHLRKLPREERSLGDPRSVDGMQLREQPTEYRGDFIKLLGRLEWLQKEPLDANPAGIEHQYRAILRSRDRILVETVFLEKPTGVELGKAVQITGYFLKNHAYLNHNSGDKSQYTWSPYIIGLDIRQPIFRDSMFTSLQSMVLGVAVILTAVFSFVLLRDRKRTKQFVDSHRERLRRARGDVDINKLGREAARLASESGREAEAGPEGRIPEKKAPEKKA